MQPLHISYVVRTTRYCTYPSLTSRPGPLSKPVSPLVLWTPLLPYLDRLDGPYAYQELCPLCHGISLLSPQFLSRTAMTTSQFHCLHTVLLWFLKQSHSSELILSENNDFTNCIRRTIIFNSHKNAVSTILNELLQNTQFHFRLRRV
jgi:hypothetical protein